MYRFTRVVFALALFTVFLAPVVSASPSEVYKAPGQELQVPVQDGEASNCRDFDGCPEPLRGVSFRDHQIGPYIAGSDDAMYALTSSAHVAYLVSYQAVVTWEICMFDADQTLIGCNQHTGDRLTVAEVEDGTEYLRVILRSGFLNEYSLQIFA